MNPTLLIQQRTKQWLAERVCELEAELDHEKMCMASCLDDNKKWHGKAAELEAENAWMRREVGRALFIVAENVYTLNDV